VKIKGTCSNCRRELFAEQVVAGGGVCPWCGRPLSPDYAMTLVDALRDAEAAGERLERALEVIAELEPAVSLDESSVTAGLKKSIARTGRNLVQQG
jgi:hypothetical protein